MSDLSGERRIRLGEGRKGTVVVMADRLGFSFRSERTVELEMGRSSQFFRAQRSTDGGFKIQCFILDNHSKYDPFFRLVLVDFSSKLKLKFLK